jgi:hypothetical protein
VVVAGDTIDIQIDELCDPVVAAVSSLEHAIIMTNFFAFPLTFLERPIEHR